MAEEQFDALCLDIENRQVDEPVILKDGRLIDGRHRWRACKKLGKPCPAVERGDDPDLEAEIIARNTHRRHLTPSQRAMMAARLARRARGRSANVAQATLSQEEAGRQFGVSRHLVIAAHKLLRSGRDDLIDAVWLGRMTLKAARRVLQGDQPKNDGTRTFQTGSRGPRASGDLVRDPRARTAPGATQVPVQRAAADEQDELDEPIVLGLIGSGAAIDDSEEGVVTRNSDPGSESSRSVTFEAADDLDPSDEDDWFAEGWVHYDATTGHVIDMTSGEQTSMPVAGDPNLDGASQLMSRASELLEFLDGLLTQQVDEPGRRAIAIELLAGLGLLIRRATEHHLWPVALGNLELVDTEPGAPTPAGPAGILVGAMLELNRSSPVSSSPPNPAVLRFLADVAHGWEPVPDPDQQDDGPEPRA